MTRLFATGYVVALAALAASTFSSTSSSTPDRVRVAPSPTGMVVPLAAVGGDSAAEVIAQVAAYADAIIRAEEDARAAAARAVVRVVPASFDYPAACEGHPVPAAILWRESHCNYGAVNSTGCGGYSCVGMYQFDLRHWMEGGGCAWLGDWTVPANQDACADQMSRGGTDLRAWGA